MKRWQWTVIFAWVGLPIIVLLSLFVLSPGYMRYMFMPIDTGLPDGLTLFFGFTGLNFTVLLFGFIISSQNSADEKPKIDATQKRLSCGTLLFLTLSFVFFTFPSFYIAIFYPAAVRVASGF